eukprot:g44365.t1
MGGNDSKRSGLGPSQRCSGGNHPGFRFGVFLKDLIGHVLFPFSILLGWSWISQSSRTMIDITNMSLEDFRKKFPDAKRKPVICVDTGKRYDSIQEASRDTGVSFWDIDCACYDQGDGGGFKWRLVEGVCSSTLKKKIPENSRRALYKGEEYFGLIFVAFSNQQRNSNHNGLTDDRRCDVAQCSIYRVLRQKVSVASPAIFLRLRTSSAFSFCLLSCNINIAMESIQY